ncbi:hypothetical protein NC651_027794 [Populus alba x Populus x berolinensis]|nr:hypothetical protein NC651_027794 [Populus alba x Populus x berolinensis]
MKRRKSNGRGRRTFEEETSFIVSPLPGLGITEAVSAPSGVSILMGGMWLGWQTPRRNSTGPVQRPHKHFYKQPHLLHHHRLPPEPVTLHAPWIPTGAATRGKL